MSKVQPLSPRTHHKRFSFRLAFRQSELSTFDKSSAMTIYWILFSLPLIGLCLSALGKAKSDFVFWVFTVIFVTLIIGLRFEVGCDWWNYLDNQEFYDSHGLNDGLSNPNWPDARERIFSAPLYEITSLVSARLSLGVLGTNLFCGVLFCIGLSMFCRVLPMPWLGWLIATPYLIVTVAMGFTAQATAVGLLLMGLAASRSGSTIPFLVSVVVGAGFHQPLIGFLPLALLLRTRPISLTLFSSFLTIASLLIGALLAPQIIQLVQDYVVSPRYPSAGSVLRTTMTLIPAVCLLAARRWMEPLTPLGLFFVRLSWGAPLLFILAFFFPSAIDRIGIYFVPIQIFALPFLISQPVLRKYRLPLISFIVVFFAAYLYVWLRYGLHAYCWVPYQLTPIF